MSVYRNIIVDIPKGHVTIEKQSGGKPALVKYVLEAPYNKEKGYATPRRTTIGHQCSGSKTTMHPTTQYREIFPALWEKVSKERVKPAVKKIGLFTACQAINFQTGIKDILDSVYGIDYAGSIMDYAMYSIIHHTDESSAFASKMRNELLYSGEPYSDSYYSRLFEEGLPQDLELNMKKAWALQCREDGADIVWLCIDGSNDDCRSEGVELAEKGHSKSGKNIDIVSFSYAVTPEGKPVTYEVYRGGLVDAKAMKSILDFLKECGIGVAGVILDRGYCSAAAIRYLIGEKIAYVIMVKGSPEGYEKMFRESGQKIKMNTEYLIPHTYLFGFQQKVQLFKSYVHEDYLTIFYDYRNGCERITTLLKNIYGEMARLEGCICKGETPAVDSRYETLLSISAEGSLHVEINKADLQTAIDEKGVYGIVTSAEMSPRKVHELYVSRSSSETQYRQVKTQLGYGRIRVHCTAGVRARFAIGFISSILRFEIEQSAKKLGRNTNQMIQELEKIEVQKLNDVYTYTHTENDRQKAFFRSMKVDPEELINESVRFENDRLAGRVPTPRHRKPGPKRGSHRKLRDESGNAVSRKSGVKPGTKRSAVNQDGKPRRKPGVKPGTKRGMYNKDGSLRKKPGPKPKTDD